MPLFRLFRLLTLSAIILHAGFSAFGQETPKPAGTPAAEAGPNQQRSALFRQLGLTPDQITKIRRLNVERRPRMDAAQSRLREANAALDAAIYADALDQPDVELKIKDAQSAQAEVQRLRFLNELEVRKILTPEQLLRFRELRKQFAESRARGNGPQRRMNRAGFNGRPGNKLGPTNRVPGETTVKRPNQP
jgi:Spy/CpxP family protein refolding chaperone